MARVEMLIRTDGTVRVSVRAAADGGCRATAEGMARALEETRAARRPGERLVEVCARRRG